MFAMKESLQDPISTESPPTRFASADRLIGRMAAEWQAAAKQLVEFMVDHGNFHLTISPEYIKRRSLRIS
ncbi:MAG: hypothetical protein OXC26_25655 [Albidovulum sp.]|nr:hypothetical protein [Albidovulum sp.]